MDYKTIESIKEDGFEGFKKMADLFLNTSSIPNESLTCPTFFTGHRGNGFVICRHDKNESNIHACEHREYSFHN